MTPKEALALANQWVKPTKAKSVKLSKGANASWVGALKGRPLLISVENKIDLGIVRGAAVFLEMK